jgi:hypothetical protein
MRPGSEQQVVPSTIARGRRAHSRSGVHLLPHLASKVTLGSTKVVARPTSPRELDDTARIALRWPGSPHCEARPLGGTAHGMVTQIAYAVAK